VEVGAIFAGDYRVVRPLSAGGMGAVWVVEQLSTSKERALKLMHPQLVADPSLRQRFEREARIGASIRSEHVVEVQAAGVDAATGSPYLVMELLRGEDLATRVARDGPMPRDQVLAIFEQLCHAVGAAHRAGIVHRDLKPENIFLAESQRVGATAAVVKVLDFGIAKVAAEADAMSKGTAPVGSPMWMSPEQTERGAVTPAADIWALGLIAFFMLTGKSYWRTANNDGTLTELLREILLEPIEPASARASALGRAHLLPAWFDGWFARCTIRDPAARFASADRMFAEMTAMTMTGVAPMHLAPTLGGMPAVARSNGGGGGVAIVVAALAVLVLASSAAIAWTTLHHRRGAQTTRTTPSSAVLVANVDPAVKYWVYIPSITNATKLSDDDARMAVFDAFRNQTASMNEVHFESSLQTREAAAATISAHALKGFEIAPVVTGDAHKVEVRVAVFSSRGELLGEVKPVASASDKSDSALVAIAADHAAQLVVDQFVLAGRNRTASSATRQDTTIVNGHLPAEAVQSVVRQNFARFKLCYETGLKSKPSLAGKVSVKLEIDETGAVSSAQDAGSTLPDASVVSCIVREFTSLRFPQPDRGTVTVVYPLTFSNGG
jgi:tRNA A-37 threonylcarbamoyl transferase component Bud32